MANNHKTIRQMLGHGLADDELRYELQTLKDNVKLLTPELLDQINQVAVKAGHGLLKKKDVEALHGRCDSFVVETDVHYPTDTNLLWDAMRKVITLLAQLCARYGVSEWRQSRYQLRQLKQLLRRLQKLKRSSSKDPAKKAQREQEIVQAHRDYLERAHELLMKADESLHRLQNELLISPLELIEIEQFIDHAERQMEQIERRVLNGETIPHAEKVFSIFEPHTEWLCKGKAGVPVELGLNVCIVEDQHGFILHHRVLVHQTDDAVAVPIVKETQQRFANLKSCSFDKGFYSPENQQALEQCLALVVLPKKGRRTQAAQARESAEPFVQARCQHAAVESAINALEVHGLDRCLDQGLEGFQRYVALAVTARNIQQVGVLLRKREAAARQRPFRRAA
jgi:hemerythrin-like domain-containing protein